MVVFRSLRVVLDLGSNLGCANAIRSNVGGRQALMEANPPGGFILTWPRGETAPARVRIDGRAAAWADGELAIPAGARVVELR